MGELEKEKGAWGYVEGGMGGVSEAIASSARSRGVDIFTEKVIYRAPMHFTLTNSSTFSSTQAFSRCIFKLLQHLTTLVNYSSLVYLF